MRTPFGTDSLSPRLLDRPRLPAWARSAKIRRTVAAVLVVLAAVDALRSDPHAGHTTVVVAAHELRPGTVLAESDVSTAFVDAAMAPPGAVTAVADVTGHTVAGPVGAGETITDVRLLGPRLAAAAIDSPDARVVPVTLADAGLADIVRVGDRVDVVTVNDTTGTGDTGPPRAAVLAEGATVVLVSAGGDTARGRDRVVLVALDADAATAVAAASLVSALTVTFH